MLLILALAGTAEAAARLPRSYQSQSSVVLLASRSASRLNGGNPYLSFGPSLTLTAEVLIQELMAPQTAHGLAARGFHSSYTVALAADTTTTTGSVLLVTVTGRDQSAVEHTLAGVTAETGAALSRLQSSVKPYDRIRATTLSFAPRPTLSMISTARPLVSAAALGLLLAFGIPVLVDGQIARRRLRSAARSGSVPDSADLAASKRRTVPEPQPGNWPPARDVGNRRPAGSAHRAAD